MMIGKEAPLRRKWVGREKSCSPIRIISNRKCHYDGKRFSTFIAAFALRNDSKLKNCARQVSKPGLLRCFDIGTIE
jgi:hypothetical protein